MAEELKKILLAEDEPDIREIETMALEMIGPFEVHAVDNGGDVQAAALSFQPQLVLMDVMMPILDGPGAFEKLKADRATSHLPVIFLTAKAMESEIARLLDMGAVGVITKPFQPATLHEEVQALWTRFHADKS